MKNLDVLQKLSLGTDCTKEVKVNFENEDYTFTMRPLSDGELTRLQAIEKKPLMVTIGMQNGKRTSVATTNDVEVNTGEFTESQAEAMYNAVALSLSVDGETVTRDDIKGLPAGLPSILFEQVVRISKLSDDDLTIIKSFRKD